MLPPHIIQSMIWEDFYGIFGFFGMVPLIFFKLDHSKIFMAFLAFLAVLHILFLHHSNILYASAQKDYFDKYAKKIAKKAKRITGGV